MSFLAKTGLVLANVKDYGALGDGIVDDTADIQAAIDDAVSAGLGGVFFPPGMYRVSQIVGLTLGASNFHFAGAGRMSSQLVVLDEDHVAGPYTLLQCRGCFNLTIDNLGFDGNKGSIINPNTGSVLLDTADCSQVEVHNNNFDNSTGSAIFVGWGDSTALRQTFRDNYLLGNTNRTFNLAAQGGIQQIMIVRNHVYQDLSTEFVHINQASNSDVFIRDNHFENTANGWNGIVVEAVDRCDISRNTILGGADGANNGIQVIASISSVFDLSIRENKILATLANASISITPTAGNVGQVAIQDNEINSEIRFLPGAGVFQELPLISGNGGYALSGFNIADLANLTEPAIVVGGSFNGGGSTPSGGTQYLGNATPEGAITGNPGDIFSNVVGGVGTTLYAKQTGAGLNTGWTALGAAQQQIISASAIANINDANWYGPPPLIGGVNNFEWSTIVGLAPDAFASGFLVPFDANVISCEIILLRRSSSPTSFMRLVRQRKTFNTAAVANQLLGAQKTLGSGNADVYRNFVYNVGTGVVAVQKNDVIIPIFQTDIAALSYHHFTMSIILEAV